MTRNFLLLILISLCAAAHTVNCSAEDSITVLTGKDGKTKGNRTGEIVDYTGESLQLKSPSGRTENIPSVKVVSIRTQWTLTHERGDGLHVEGKLEEAITAYKQAKREEPRVWARRKIMAQLVACYAELGRFELAGDEWLVIVTSDPSTMHFAVIPVGWHSLPPDAALEPRAAAWLASKSPAAQVLGASWLLSGTQRGAATAALDGLVANKSLDPRIRALAQVQLWRTKLVSVKLDEAQRWQSAVEQMPPEVRASGYFVVGEALAGLNQPAATEAAAIAFLRIPLVHSEQRAMAADALLAAAKLHEKLKRDEQAAGLYREVVSGYSRTAAAAEARARLEKK